MPPPSLYPEDGGIKALRHHYMVSEAPEEHGLNPHHCGTSYLACDTRLTNQVHPTTSRLNVKMKNFSSETKSGICLLE
jgi:hypothetical protein